MITFIRTFIVFIKGSIHYGILNRGLGEFAPKALVLPLNPRLTPLTQMSAVGSSASQP